MIGHIGFHASPGANYLEQWSPGGAEFGFAIYPSHRRHRYAREASLALMKWAHDIHGVKSFVVTISPENEASLSLAKGLGFRRVGVHYDEVDGLEEVLVLNVVPDA